MLKTRNHAFAAALAIAGGALLASPAAARPDPDRAVSLWDPFGNNGCFVTDAAGASTLDTGCKAHLALRTIDGEFAVAMYQDHGQLPPGAALPSTATVRDTSYTLEGVGLVTCSETITPSGGYKSKCYFNVRTQ